MAALKTATEHAINVTYVAQRVFLNGADVCRGRCRRPHRPLAQVLVEDREDAKGGEVC
eukprot:Skav203237  [mRNA]  locus=scaffold2746:107938:109508:- [translate_table: standard]